MTRKGSRSPQRKAREFMLHQDSPETSKENEDDNQARLDSKVDISLIILNFSLVFIELNVAISIF